MSIITKTIVFISVMTIISTNYNNGAKSLAVEAFVGVAQNIMHTKKTNKNDRIKMIGNSYLNNLNGNNDISTTNIKKDDLKKDVQSSIFGGDIIRRIKMEGETDEEDDSSFVGAMKVPTYAAFSHPNQQQQYSSSNLSKKETTTKPTKAGLEGVIPGAFLLHNAFSPSTCEEIITTCETLLQFTKFKAGKNNHGAMQILVTPDFADALFQIIGPFIDINTLPPSFQNKEETFLPIGTNRRWRIYKYAPNQEETFAPHIDAGFKPSGLSQDGSTLLWDVTNNPNAEENIKEEVVSRLTVLIYLNDDFSGGHTRFYAPLAPEEENNEIVASVKPRQGSILLFPQAVGEDHVEYANHYWNLHEGSAVKHGNRGKYVIRTDVLFSSSIKEEEEVINKEEYKLFQYDDVVRQTFLPKSTQTHNPTFLHHVQHLYNPHMGVENVSYLLYSFIRFTKARNIVEIGSGYTTLWILQALKDNEEEMGNIRELQREGKCKLFDWPWTVPDKVEQWDDDEREREQQQRETSSSPFFGSSTSSSLVCIDNCLHQRETATGASSVARTLNLDQYLHFIKGDAFEISFDKNSIDVLWCDFGVGSNIKEYVSNVWDSIRLGGFLIFHSSLTNEKTRQWLECCRRREGKGVTGLDPMEYVELSLLEPHKHYQNSISIFQKRCQRRDGGDGYEVFEEPLFSVYA